MGMSLVSYEGSAKPSLLLRILIPVLEECRESGSNLRDAASGTNCRCSWETAVAVVDQIKAEGSTRPEESRATEGLKESRRQRSSILHSRIDPPGMSRGEKEEEASSERYHWRGDLGTCEEICKRMTRRCFRYGMLDVGIVAAAVVAVVGEGEGEGERWIRIVCYRLDWRLTWQREGVGMSWVGPETTGSRRC